MLKESFFFPPSYKYGHLKRNFFCGTNVEEDVEEDARFSCFCRVLPQQSWFDTNYFDPSIPGDYFNTLSVLLNILRPRRVSLN